MKKKSVKKKKPTKQKIDVVLESLLNLERIVKSLVANIEQLRYTQSRFKDCEMPEKKENTNKYWPNVNESSWTWNDNKYIRGFDGTDSAGVV